MALQNPHRVDLGKALERYRIRAGLSTTQLEQAVGWGSGKASRVEDGKRTLTNGDVMALKDALKLSPEELDELTELAALARRRTANPSVADYAAAYVAFEQAAEGIDAYSDELIPGIAQSPAYIAALLACSCSDPTVLAARMAARIDRQKVFAMEHPPKVRLLLGEGVLRRPVGGNIGLRQALEHLLMLRDMSGIEIHLLPYSIGAHKGLGSRFSVVRRKRGDTRVYVEGVLDATYYHRREDVEAHEQVFEDLLGVAMSDEESATILRKRIQQLA